MKTIINDNLPKDFKVDHYFGIFSDIDEISYFIFNLKST